MPHVRPAPARPAPPRPPHRPPYAPTEQVRKSVRAMTAYGIDQDQIAGVVGISRPTLRKHFRRELDVAAPEANARIAEALYRKALAGDVIAMIFWLKVRAKWSERIIVQDGGQADDFNPATLSDAEINARLARLSGKLSRAIH